MSKPCMKSMGWDTRAMDSIIKSGQKDTEESIPNRKKDLILIMTPEKKDKTLELSKHWSPDSTLARNEVIIKTTYPVNQ